MREISYAPHFCVSSSSVDRWPLDTTLIVRLLSDTIVPPEDAKTIGSPLPHESGIGLMINVTVFEVTVELLDWDSGSLLGKGVL